MEWSAWFESIGKLVALAGTIAGGWWAIEKWRRRDEHFPRVYFEVGLNFVGSKDDRILVEIVASLENKGVVPLKIRNFSFKLRGIKSEDRVVRGDQQIRGQVIFPHELASGPLVPADWEYSFVYPGVRTDYNFVTDIPNNVCFVRVQADFDYGLKGETHHAAKILGVPKLAEAR